MCLYNMYCVLQIKISLSEHDEQSGVDTPTLDLTVTTVTTSVQLHTWDMSVDASIGSVAIDDHYKREGEESTQLLSNVTSKDAEKQPFLSVKYTKVCLCKSCCCFQVHIIMSI